MKLPGLGYRSSERIALNLLLEQPEKLVRLVEAIDEAKGKIKRCETCGNITEESLCSLCSNQNRNQQALCIVEQVPDLYAIERSGSFNGRYHVLHGRLSPINGIGPEHLNLQTLINRIETNNIEEIILALSNDIEGEATCHYLQEEVIPPIIAVTRIAFGLPSGGTLLYADSATLKSALDGRRSY